MTKVLTISLEKRPDHRSGLLLIVIRENSRRLHQAFLGEGFLDLRARGDAAL